MADNSDKGAISSSGRITKKKSKKVIQKCNLSHSKSSRTIFSLSKLAYHACSETDKQWCIEHCPMAKVDSNKCCVDLIKLIQEETDFSLSTDPDTAMIQLNKRYQFIFNKYAKVCFDAVCNGHLDCLMVAHEKGLFWDSDTCKAAVQNNHLECLKYAYENGCAWNEYTCMYAALNGNIECLKYAVENGCPWSKKTAYTAARYGKLDCLKFALENGCPWDSRTCVLATRHGHVDCAKYIHDNFSQTDGEQCKLCYDVKPFLSKQKKNGKPT